MDQQITPSAAVVRAFASARPQFVNALENLDAQAGFLAEVVDTADASSVDEYNAAVTLNEQLNAELDGAHHQIGVLKLEIHGLNERHAEFEDRALTAETKAAKADTKSVYEKSRADQAERELKRLRELNPDRLAKSSKEKTKLLDEQRKMLTELRNSNIALKRDEAKSQGKIAELCKVIEEMDVEIQLYRKRDDVKVIFEKHLKEPYRVTLHDEEMPAFVYLLPAGFSTHDDSLLELDFKLFVMSATGEGVAVMLDKWLCPCAPKTDFTDSWPTKLNNAITEFAREALEHSHDDLVARHDWACTVPVSDVVSEKVAEILLANDILTLKDIMFNTLRLKSFKGLGVKTAETIMQQANTFIANSIHGAQEVA